MNDLFFYINTAFERSNISSDRKLCEKLGVSKNAISHYKKGALPSDDTMIKIAQLAQIPPHKALMDLNVWRAPEAVKPFYIEIAQRFTQAAIIAAMALGLFISSASPTLAQKVSNDCAANVYYGKLKLLLLKAIKALVSCFLPYRYTKLDTYTLV